MKKTLLALFVSTMVLPLTALSAPTIADEVKTVAQEPVFGVQSIDKKTIEEAALEHKLKMQKLNEEIKGKRSLSPKEWSEDYASYGIYDDNDLDPDELFKMLGIATEPEMKKDDLPPDLDSVLSFKLEDDLKTKIDEARYRMIHESAMRYGLQAGLARQNYEIRQRLEKIANSLDFTYNFQRFMMQGNILPPVISEANNNFEQLSDDVIHLGLKNYTILSDARLTYSPPTWRSYLMRKFENAKAPSISLDPDNKFEKQLRAKSIEQGWKAGVAQANRMLYENWLTLVRDYRGIILYHELLAKKIVSAPYLSVQTRDIVGNSKDLTVGDVTLSIAVKPEFVLERNQWNKNARSGQKGFIGGKGRGAEYIEFKPKNRK